MFEEKGKLAEIMAMKLISMSLLCFSIMLFVEKDLIYTAIALLCVAIYFGCLGWNKIKRSNLLYLTLMLLFSLSLAYEVGVSVKLLLVLAIVYISFFYINYILLSDDIK